VAYVCVDPDDEVGGGPGADQQQLTQRQVVVQRDEKGYGFTVEGDEAVLIKTVKESTLTRL